MGKNKKYSNEGLLEAVIKYSEFEAGIIIVTELADWCRHNIEGLEDVRDYHFSRKEKVLDSRSGKFIEQDKSCMKKINEINNFRRTTNKAATNCLLHSSCLDSFHELPRGKKDEAIRDVRRLIEEMKKKEIASDKTIEEQKRLLAISDEKLNYLSESCDAIHSKIATIEKQIRFLTKVYTEEECKKKLAEMGIENGDVDLDKNFASLKVDEKNILDFRKEIIKYKGIIEPSEIKEEISAESDEPQKSLGRRILEDFDL